MPSDTCPYTRVAVSIARGIDFAECGAIVQQELAEVSRAVILSNLTELVDGLEIIKNDLQDIHITTKSLQNSSNNLARSKSRECKSILQPPSSGTSVMSDTHWLIC